jgi:hypothetical protein
MANKCSGLPKAYSGRPVKGLPYAMQNISVQLAVTVEELLATLRASVWTVIVPGMIILLAITIAVTVAWRIQKMLYPPTAAELHRQALLLLQKQEQEQIPVTTKKRQDEEQQQQVVDLLNKALQQDPNYLPARLSLIAVYLYRLNDGHKAVRELKELSEEEHHNGDTTMAETKVQTRGLLLDAQAVIAGQGHMVQGILQEDRYLRTIPPAAPMKKSERRKWWFGSSPPAIDKHNQNTDRSTIKRKTQ